MNPDRLDDLVRKANALDADRCATLGDPQLRRRLYEEITTVDTSAPPAPASRRLRWRPIAITASVTAVVAAAAVIVLTTQTGQPSATTVAQSPTAAASTGGPQGDVFGEAASCVEEYSPQTLAERAFAFDGTVQAIGEPGLYAAVPVTFQVHRWYRGGQNATVTVAMGPPGGNTSDGAGSYGIGSRLLVSGEPRFGGKPLDGPIAWSCGFTRWRTPADAAVWQQTFG